MLLDFFYTLRSAKLPVSVKEYLTLMEALKKGVVGPNVGISDIDSGEPSGYAIDDFYYLARTALVKDEKHYDKFDRAFAAYFKGVDMVADFTKEIPADWLRKNLEKFLTPEEQAKVQKMGWDELMETLKKRLEEQKERINRHAIEWQRKFTLSVACMLLFLIGAPLGAIVRKGGLGMPVVISLIFFVAYYMISITGEKLAREGVLSAFNGMWLSTYILLPLGIFITWKATHDSPLFDRDLYVRMGSGLVKLIIRKK